MAVDATGKVKGPLSSGLDDAVQISRSSQAGSQAAKTAGTAGDGASVLDRVDVSIAKTISDALDPEKLSAERKDKIAKLKELIASGQYKPSGEDIARSVADEITQEIYFNQNQSE